jgi:RNA polymerase sigma factor (sigma-70 family)
MAVFLQPLLEHVQQLAARLEVDAESVLLDRFVRQRDGAAFAALVHRHGPMVLGVCRRLLGNTHDAEDVFQATFFVLARQATAGRVPNSLPAWLHGVARRLALKHRRDQRSRARFEARSVQANGGRLPGDPLEQLTARELLQAVDEELQRLPDAYRQPLILCCLEGRTQDEAAGMLGWTAGSVRGRLQRGRALLQTRLARRGLGLGTGLLAVTALGPGMAAGLPPRVARATVEAALRFAAGCNVQVAASVVAIAEEALGAARTAVLKIVTLLLGVTLAVAAGGVLARQTGTLDPVPSLQQTNEPKADAAPPGQAGAARPAATRTDRYGDPLPPETLARLGTMRWRHSSQVRQVLFAPDGKTVASTGSDNSVRLWEATTGALLHRLEHPGGLDLFASFLGKGETLVSTQGGKFWVWDVRTGKQLREVKLLEASLPYLNTAAISLDGKVAALGNYEGTITLWNLATGEPLRKLTGNDKWIGRLSFSPDGKTLAVASTKADGPEKEGKTVRLWDVTTGQQLAELVHAPGTVVNALCFAPTGTILATGGQETTSDKRAGVHLWNGSTGKLLHRLEGHRQAIASLCFAPDGKTLASLGGDRTIRLWNVNTGKELRQLPYDHEINAHFEAAVLAFSPDSKTLAVGDGPVVRRWNVREGQELPPPEGHAGMILGLSLSADGQKVLTLGADRSVRLWDARSGESLRTFAAPTSAAALAPDGMVVACGRWPDKTITLWDTATGKPLRQLEGHEEAVACLVFSPDGKTLASSSHDKSVRLWEVATGQLLHRLQPGDGAASLEFAPDGKALVAGTGQGVVHLWDLTTGKELWKIAPDSADLGQRAWGCCEKVAFSPDRKLVAAASAATILVVDAQTGQKRDILHCSSVGRILGLAFSPNGRMLASAGNGDGIVVWEMYAGADKECHVFGAKHSEILTLAYSADGRRLVSGNTDSTALIWDVTGLAGASNSSVSAAVATLWRDLGSPDAARAFQARRHLAAQPEQAVPLLAGYLLPKKPDARQTARLLAQLDNDDFATREKATAEVRRLGAVILPALYQALKDEPTLELRRRVQELLDEIDPRDHGVSLNMVRLARAVEVLEWIGNTAARQVLQKVAASSPGEDVGEQAQGALDRLAKRSPSRP